MTVDAGVALVVSDEGEFTETNGAQQERTFEAEGTAYLSSVQLNYTFN
jgi:long-chain fatty acid transport protein